MLSAESGRCVQGTIEPGVMFLTLNPASLVGKSAAELSPPRRSMVLNLLNQEPSRDLGFQALMFLVMASHR